MITGATPRDGKFACFREVLLRKYGGTSVFNSLIFMFEILAHPLRE